MASESPAAKVWGFTEHGSEPRWIHFSASTWTRCFCQPLLIVQHDMEKAELHTLFGTKGKCCLRIESLHGILACGHRARCTGRVDSDTCRKVHCRLQYYYSAVFRNATPGLRLLGLPWVHTAHADATCSTATCGDLVHNSLSPVAAGQRQCLRCSCLAMPPI